MRRLERGRPLFFPRDRTQHSRAGSASLNSLGSFASRGACVRGVRSCRSCVRGFPDAVLRCMLSTNLISGLREGERRGKEGEGAGEAAGASDGSRKHQPGPNLLRKCDMSRCSGRICGLHKSFTFFFFLVFSSFKNLIGPQMPRID